MEIFAWCSIPIPCTGGSPWQTLNKAKSMSIWQKGWTNNKSLPEDSLNRRSTRQELCPPAPPQKKVKNTSRH
eukprot:4493663-Amphidinium_carterae.1